MALIILLYLTLDSFTFQGEAIKAGIALKACTMLQFCQVWPSDNIETFLVISEVPLPIAVNNPFQI